MDRREFFVTTAASAGALGSSRGSDKSTTNGAGGRRTEAVLTRAQTRLRVRDWGQGRAIVLLAGWGLPSDFWDALLVDVVARGRRCVAYDRRGHGRSDEPGDGYDYDALADDLAVVLDTLNLGEITIVGHSMAAGEIVRYETRHGAGRIAHAVLVAPVTPGLARSSGNPNGVPLEMLAAARQ